jgi:hypothetical protein
MPACHSPICCLLSALCSQPHFSVPPLFTHIPRASQIYDSRGLPTVEVVVVTPLGKLHSPPLRTMTMVVVVVVVVVAALALPTAAHYNTSHDHKLGEYRAAVPSGASTGANSSPFLCFADCLFSLTFYVPLLKFQLSSSYLHIFVYLLLAPLEAHLVSP